MSNIDWEKIKTEYLQGGTSYRKLAGKHGVSFSTLEKRARSENWAEQRKEVGDKAAAKARQKIVSQRAKDIEALDRTRSMLIARLEKSVSKFPDIPGNRMEQSVSDLIPSKGKTGDGAGKRNDLMAKTVKVESDLIKMVTALEKLIAMSGYDAAGQDTGVLNEIIEAVKNV